MKETCKQEGCERTEGKALGYCNAHYLRFTRGRNMDAPIRNHRATDQERFWAKVAKSDGCWTWKGARVNATGYGVFRLNARNQVSHRVAFAWANGSIPDGYEVDHTCFNRSCVNPEHLRLLTHQENGQNRAGANSNSKSGVRGVHRVKDQWLARVSVGPKVHSIGRFDDLGEAEKAIKEWRRRNMPVSLRDAERKAS